MSWQDSEKTDDIQPRHIALIAPYKGMAHTAYEVSKDFDIPIEFVVGDLQAGLEKGRKLADAGTEVFISRGGTAQLLKKYLSIPVVEIRVTAYDILVALQQVKPGNHRIGIIGFENVIYGAEKLGRLLNLDLAVFSISREEEVSAKLEEARKMNVSTIIGDRVVISQVLKNGQNGLLIESGKESILQSFHEAQKILEALRVETARNKKNLETLNQLKAVLDSVDDQIIILDSNDCIVSCNPAALDVFQAPKSTVVGKPLQVYPALPLEESCKKSMPVRQHLALVKDRHVLLDYLPIETKGVRSGTLILGRSVQQVENDERKIRKELQLKGHVAKYSFRDIKTADKKFKGLIQRAKRFGKSKSTILIIGETGTGKEMMAQSIHNESYGPDRPFVAINCATLPEPLLESELFGYAPGAFTGAGKNQKKGYFELAHGGTLLLDEIGELPFKLQSRLLRVIEEREIQPIGDDRVIPVDIRIIAATNRDLINAVTEQSFRADLFYRLNVLNLEIPPLRQRGKDAYLLFKLMALEVNPGIEKKKLFRARINKILCSYHWPGNVRELRNLVERLAILTDNFSGPFDEFEYLLKGEFQKSEGLEKEDVLPEADNLNLKALEQSVVQRLCKSKMFTQDEIARALGISRTKLWKIRKSL